jgi:sulfoxide reductase catalytic subunit YedY
MPSVRTRRSWELPGLRPTSESDYMNRRRFLEALGVAGLSATALVSGCGNATPDAASRTTPAAAGTAAGADTAGAAVAARFPAPRNEAYALDRPLSAESDVLRYNNFYEFTERKDGVHELVGRFKPWPWTIEVTGLVDRPATFDVEDLVRTMPLEERLYRFRCVERWAMAVPWTGFPLSALLDRVQPKSNATHVRFVTFLRPDEAPNQKTATWYPWPYYEGLTMAEARNELTLLAVGLYGKPLAKQNGAPVRLVVPWKYGYKSAKSIVRIELVDRQPPTFWNDLAADEYGFTSNVDPGTPHPRWSQATEWMIPDMTDRRPTELYNGYGAQVARLYPKG